MTIADIEDELNEFGNNSIEYLFRSWEVWARDAQLPPTDDDWRTWLILGGRGAGKTRAGAEWVRAQALGLAPFAKQAVQRIALVGETYHDARSVMVEGVSGLLAIHANDERPAFYASRNELIWPNGSIAQLFSAEDPDSLRGPQFGAAWCAAFVGACLKRAGKSGTGSLMARSYLAWGEALQRPKVGAVVVLKRGSDPWAGHVGFWVGETNTAHIIVGGNQSNAVTVSAYAKDRLLGFRWPRETADSGDATDATSLGTLPFKQALEHVLEMEGGFTNDPDDPGGPTNKGVILKVFCRHMGRPLNTFTRKRRIAELREIPDTIACRRDARGHCIHAFRCISQSRPDGCGATATADSRIARFEPGCRRRDWPVDDGRYRQS